MERGQDRVKMPEHPTERPISGLLMSFYRRPAGRPDDSTWIVSLSDLMSLLLIFFLVWNAVKISSMRLPAEYPEAQEMLFRQDPELTGLRDSLLEFSPVTTDKGNVIIVLQDGITFSSGTALLSDKVRKTIQRIKTDLI